MSAALPNRVAAPFVSTFLLGLVLAPQSLLPAQELQLKRQVPESDPLTCLPLPAPEGPGAEERAEASRLASSAEQSLILGDTDRAREFLDGLLQADLRRWPAAEQALGSALRVAPDWAEGRSRPSDPPFGSPRTGPKPFTAEV